MLHQISSFKYASLRSHHYKTWTTASTSGHKLQPIFGKFLYIRTQQNHEWLHA